MRILLLTFTGTGNTKLCGDFIAENFVNEGHEVTHYVYKHDVPFNEDVNSYDMIGVGYPIHAFNVPEIFYKWMKSLPKVENKPYFIYKVSGEPFHFNDASSHHFVKVLKKKGYQKISEKHFLMPYNIMFRYKDEIAKQMYIYLQALTKLYVKEILAGDYEVIKYHFDKKVLSFLLRIEWIAPRINAPLCHVNKKCTNCHMCINNCPSGALFINKKNKIRIKSSKCTMCMRCAFLCPQDAFKFGIMNPWRVNGSYKYKELEKNQDINGDYINKNTKGYFKKFNKYFTRQNQLLEKYGIEVKL